MHHMNAREHRMIPLIYLQWHMRDLSNIYVCLCSESEYFSSMIWAYRGRQGQSGTEGDRERQRGIGYGASGTMAVICMHTHFVACYNHSHKGCSALAPPTTCRNKRRATQRQARGSADGCCHRRNHGYSASARFARRRGARGSCLLQFKDLHTQSHSLLDLETAIAAFLLQSLTHSGAILPPRHQINRLQLSCFLALNTLG